MRHRLVHDVNNSGSRDEPESWDGRLFAVVPNPPASAASLLCWSRRTGAEATRDKPGNKSKKVKPPLFVRGVFATFGDRCRRLQVGCGFFNDFFLVDDRLR